MPFWKKKISDKETSPDLYIPRNPYITFELIDGEHLDIDMAWPLDGDVSSFIKMLTILNSGNLAGPQVAEAAIYAQKVGQQDKASAIYNALEPFLHGKKDKEKEKGKGRPVIRPSRVIPNLLKGNK